VNTAKQRPTDEMHFSSKEFDRIMGQALQAKPKSKKAVKAKDTAKKRKAVK